MPEITVGVLVVTGKVGKSERLMLASWLTLNMVVVLCGFFGKGPKATIFASELAKAAGAVGYGPCHQVVSFHDPRSREFKVRTHPSYMMLFGYYNAMSWPEKPWEVPENFEMGRDILDELIGLAAVPQWKQNCEGSTLVPSMGNVKMKPVDIDRWFQHCFQSCVWLGTSIPSKKSQSKARERGCAKP